MSTLLHDLKYARRLLVRNPAFTAIAVITLALGIGLNTAVFSAIDALLLRPLPGVRAPEELVQLYRTYPGGELYGSNGVPHFMDVRDRSKDVFSGVSAWSIEQLSVASGGRTERVYGMMVSADFFSVLGVSADRGRTFVQEEDKGPGAHPVAVLTYHGWKGFFGGDPKIVGRTVVLNGQTYTIVGVTPEEFRGPLPVVTPTLFVPLVQIDQIRPGRIGQLDFRGNNFMNVAARLKPGVTVEKARDRMQALSNQFLEEHPDDYKGAGINVVLQGDAGIHPLFRAAQVQLSTVVMVVVLLLLLIACVNVANLFLARARDRSREMAVRLSLGARRGIIIRQLLTESLVFSSVAGLAGLGVAWWAINIANHIKLPVDIDFSADLRLSPSVLLFTLGISVLTGLLFGLAPALQATRPSLVPALKGEAPAGESRSRMSRGLVVAQMALSIVLLVCAGLFLRNLKSATDVDKGFVSDNLLLAELDPGLQGYTRPRTEEFYRRLLDRVRALPGVKSAALGGDVPLGMSSSDRGVSIPGYTPRPNEGMSINYSITAPGYLEALGVRVLKGRDFSIRDDSVAPRVLIVNQLFADRYWPGQDPIGKTVRVAGGDHTVIGLVPTGKYRRLGEDPTAFMYLAQAQHWNSGMALYVRTTVDPTTLVPALRSEVAALDANMPVSNVRTMNTHLGIALLPARLAGTTLGIFGFLGLILASVGIYGVMSYAVAQRTREIGIRMAIGAASGSVVQLMMRQGLFLVLIGTAIGMGGAIVSARLIRGVLYGGGASDPFTFVTVPFVLIGVAMIAIWIPARRASSVDPVIALRQE
jgi:macrolide transport system ATP-binding/permease protein